MTPPGMEWTDAHSEASTNEGWDIFDVNGSGYLEIQRGLTSSICLAPTKRPWSSFGETQLLPRTPAI